MLRDPKQKLKPTHCPCIDLLIQSFVEQGRKLFLGPLLILVFCIWTAMYLKGKYIKYFTYRSHKRISIESIAFYESVIDIFTTYFGNLMIFHASSISKLTHTYNIIDLGTFVYFPCTVKESIFSLVHTYKHILMKKR